MKRWAWALLPFVGTALAITLYFAVDTTLGLAVAGATVVSAWSGRPDAER